jgi:predicted TIM-barrel fold metal-dependent hydrolase
MTSAQGNGTNGHGADDKVIIVSCDTHIGPRVKEDLRPYCPKKYLDQFDDFIAYLEQNPPMTVPGLELTTGHFDMHQRIRDLNVDGTAGEVIFHGSQNGQPIPFNVSDFSTGSLTAVRQYDVDQELAAVGRHIYNEWLADQCSIEPERHIGLAQLPMWDIDAAVKELEWARNAGLRGVNFPAASGDEVSTRSRYVGKHVYHDPAWDPFWAACQDLGTALCAHGGAGNPNIDLPGGHSIWLYEAQEQSKRPIARMILGGVFERFPGLKLVVTEQPGDWWRTKMLDLDSLETPKGGGFAGLPQKPSFYMSRNCFMGASFQARFEAEDSIKHGYWTNIIWGTDYPHTEGTWKWQDDDNIEPYSQKSLRYTYHDLPEHEVKAMLGLNAIDVYGFDGEYLFKVAQQINAPTMEQVNTPLDQIPEDHGMWAFRQVATFA